MFLSRVMSMQKYILLEGMNPVLNISIDSSLSALILQFDMQKNSDITNFIDSIKKPVSKYSVSGDSMTIISEFHLSSDTMASIDKQAIRRLIDYLNRKTKEQMTQELFYLAHNDQLTGLRNRHSYSIAIDDFMDELDLNQDFRLGVVYIDLDKFKPINDTYGHDAGDAVLKHIALMMEKSLPKHALGFRIGGDEFTVLVKNVESSDELIDISYQVRQAIMSPLEFGGNTFEVGSSIGVSIFDKSSKNIESVLKIADEAMYIAKKSTTKKVVYTKS
jgi:diguanylate cyclase (GGDEF)-like protein